MEWYIPMTIIPGIGLIILSTSNIMLALNNEITQLCKEEKKRAIIQLKLAQLKRVSIAIVLQYIGILLFLIAGIVSSIFSLPEGVPKAFLTTGVLVISISLIILLIYSIKAVSIRQQHLKL